MVSRFGFGFGLDRRPRGAPALNLGPELIVNGAGTNLTGWSQNVFGNDGIITINNSRFRIQSGPSNSWGNIGQNPTVEIGAQYRFLGTNHGGTANGTIFLGNAYGYGQYFASSAVQAHEAIIVPTQASIFLLAQAGYPGGYREFSGFSLRKIL